MHYTLIIISNTITKEYLNKINVDYLILNEATLIDNYSLNSNNIEYTFDYLIITDLSLINNIQIEIEHKKALTNFYMQTSVDNIFAIANASNSSLPEFEQLEIVLYYLINPEIF